MSDTTESPSIAALAAALAKAQGAIEGAAKDRTNPHFGAKYATLASCWDACRAPLAANGLAVVQRLAADKGMVSVETILAHSSGEWIRSTLTVPATKPDAQGIGSAVTYARRYSLSAMVGIAPDDDDDGTAAAHPAKGRTEAPRNASARTATVAAQVASVARPGPEKPAPLPSEPKSTVPGLVDVSDGETEAAAKKRALEFTARKHADWTRAKAHGVTSEALFRGWVEGVIGEPIPSSKWSVVETAKLEAALRKMEPPEGVALPGCTETV